MTFEKPQRIAKFLAHAGVCSRRAAEKLILEGKVFVNGKCLESPACVITSKDLIEIEGKKIQSREETHLWLYYKPVGFLCTSQDPQGRATIFDDLAKYRLPYVVSVGRLDFNSEGLLLLTNNGELARFLELPATGYKRHYRVRVRGIVREEDFLPLQKGITVEGVSYQPMEVDIEHHQSSNTWIRMTLSEGKNREIRRIMDHLGYPVNRLVRMSYGDFHLSNLKLGEITEVPQEKVKKLFEKSGVL